MAEFAQLKFEEWSPIFMEMKRIGLLDDVETRRLASTIQDKIYSIQKTTRQLDHVLDYVNFQMQLLKDIRLRRDKIQCEEKYTEIDEQIKFGINSLFGVYERAFCKDLKFWNARIAFGLAMNWLDVVSTTYRAALNHLGPENKFLFEHASTFEWQRNPDKYVDAARQILSEGMRIRKTDLDMFLYMYNFDMRHAEYLHQKQTISTISSIYEGKAEKYLDSAELTYKLAINDCYRKGCTVQLYLKFFNIAENYPYCQSVQAHILRDLELNCTDEEEAYAVLAKVAFSRRDLSNAIVDLDRGIGKFKNEKMYELAVNCFWEAIQTVLDDGLVTHLYAVLKKGLADQLLSPRCFIVWLNLFTWSKTAQWSSHSDIDRGQVLEEAIKKYPRNVELLLEVLKAQYHKQSSFENLPSVDKVINTLLTCCSSKDGEDKVLEQIFDVVVLVVGNSTIFKYNPILDIEHKLKNLINASEKLAAKYINIVLLIGGINLVRECIPRLALKDSYQVLKTLAQIEFQHLDHDLPMQQKCQPFRECMEKACIFYGKDIDVWIEYMKLEKMLRNEKEASDIYSRALKTVKNKASLIEQEQLILKRLKIN